MKPGYKKVYFKSLESFNKWLAQGKLAYAADNYKFRINKGIVQYKTGNIWISSLSFKSDPIHFFNLTPLYKYVKINEKKNLPPSPSVSNRSRD